MATFAHKNKCLIWPRGMMRAQGAIVLMALALALALTLAAPATAESRFLNDRVKSHLRAGAAACATYFTAGRDLAALESALREKGFDRELRDWVWDTHIHGVTEGKLTVSVRAGSGKCKLAMSNATRSDSKWLNNTMAEAFVARGFTDTRNDKGRRKLRTDALKLGLDGYAHRHTDELSASVTVSE